MDKSIYTTAVYSLLIQAFIAIVCILGIFIKLDSKDKILNDILILETIVQIVEFTFYVWLIYNFATLNINVTLVRYLDWFITTPTMLFTLIAFMIYRNNTLNNINTENMSFKEIINSHFNTLAYIFVANAGMLFLGFLGEYNAITKNLAFITGTILLLISFYLIYYNFVSSDWLNNYLFWFNFILWSGYGVAYMCSYTTKNVIYNIIDIFSKNINGLLIFSYILFNKSPNFLSGI